MKKELIKIRNWQEHSYYGHDKYFAEVLHEELGGLKILSSNDPKILKNKIDSYVSALELKWQKTSLKEKVDLMNKEATAKINEIENILSYTLKVDKNFIWNNLKDNQNFKKEKPKRNFEEKNSKIPYPKQINHFQFPDKPKKQEYEEPLSFFDKIIKSRKENKIVIAKTNYDTALIEWENECDKIDKKNNELDLKYQSEISRYERKKLELREEESNKLELEIQKWNKEKNSFLAKQKEKNSIVDNFKKDYLNHIPLAVTEYCSQILKQSKYPIEISQENRLEYNLDTKILIIDLSLPTFESFPIIKEYKIIGNQIKEYYISESQRLKTFDETMYIITLRTIFELFQTDQANALEAISFNGWINNIDKATGKEQNTCILSIQIKKNEFMTVNLKQVDPKTCFKNFKGIGSSKLSSLVAIQPVLQINRTDKRFTSYYDVADSLDDSTNLASIDWQDFEHLIREVFGQEFNIFGGEVKITQASRDGGVDAVAFDPDPIRGGKIVIQAKRYTNTVGVSAVRDLYGTVMNEGATKGILVTTANYGPDAYEFAKGKPLTLMNGANLLYLLEKHGHKARIDLKEAKMNIQFEQENWHRKYE